VDSLVSFCPNCVVRNCERPVHLAACCGLVSLLVPLILALHVLWRWSSDVKKFLLLRYFVAAVAVLSLAALSSLSIWNASRPNFLLMWPGLVFSDGSTRAYYWAAERRSVQNPTIIVWDDGNPTNTITLRPGNIDPRIGGFADYFRFQPAKLGHERMTIITQSKDIDTDENLVVETRGRPALFPSWKAIIRNSRTGRIIFQCESDDFPAKSNLQTCPLNPLEIDGK
jgi:hypothetical protein